jgi:hypothetical protein
MDDPVVEVVLKRERDGRVLQLCAALPHNEGYALSWHLGLSGEPQTFRKIATDLRCSPAHAHALKERAIARLATQLELEGLA